MIAGLVLAAFLTAALSGMAGLGGGTILIAILFAVGLPPAVAVPIHAAVQLVSNFSRTIAFGRHLRWAALGVFVAAAAPAAFLVAPFAADADPRALRLALGLFILVATWLPPLRARFDKQRSGTVSPTPAYLLAGALAGGLGAVVGATGAIIAPLFLRDDWTKDNLIGTTALCQGAAHLLKVLAFGVAGFAIGDHVSLIAPMAIAVVAGTFLGKSFAGRIPEGRFRILIRTILTVLAAKLLLGN